MVEQSKLFSEVYIKEETYKHGMVKINHTSMRLLGFEEDFDLKQTFECGQCFRWSEIKVPSDSRYVMQKYRGVVKQYIVDVVKYKDGAIDIELYQGQSENPSKSEGDKVFNGEKSTRRRDAENTYDMMLIYPFFVDYFDLKTDYKSIKETLMKKDITLAPMVQYGFGIRLLRQPMEETLYSFIISANNNIKRIKGSIDHLACQYGQYLGEIQGQKYYSFPSYKELEALSKEDFRELGLGYRDNYMVDAVNYMKEDFETEVLKLSDSYEESKSTLKKIKGIGDKVADCILLFSLGFREAFPIDTWMKKMMMTYYQIDSVDVMQKYAKTYFSPYGGYAQQYMFYYGLSGQMSRETVDKK